MSLCPAPRRYPFPPARRRTRPGSGPDRRARPAVEVLESRLTPSIQITGFTPGQQVTHNLTVGLTVSEAVPSGGNFAIQVGVSGADPGLCQYAAPGLGLSPYRDWPSTLISATVDSSVRPSGFMDGPAMQGWPVLDASGNNPPQFFSFSYDVNFQPLPNTTPYLFITVGGWDAQGHALGILESQVLPFQLVTHPYSLVYTQQPTSGLVDSPLAPVQVTAVKGKPGDLSPYRNHAFVPAAGASVQLTLNQVLGQGTLSGTTSGAAGADGTITFNDLSVSSFGYYTLAVSGDPNALGGTSDSFRVQGNYPLTFLQQPASGHAGPLNPSDLQVQATDEQGNPVPGLSISLLLKGGAFSRFPGGVQWGYTVTDAQGVATFANLTVTYAGKGYTFTAASVYDTQTGVSNPFDLAAETLSFARQPAPGKAGTLAPVQVLAVDGSGNPAPGIPVTLTMNSDPGSLSGVTQATTNDQGLATFDQLRIDRPGTYQLTAAAPGDQPVTSSSFTLAGVALSFSPGPAAVADVDHPLPEVDVRALDDQGNPAAGVPITLSLQDSGGAVHPLGGTLTVVTDGEGRARFGDLAVNQTGQGFTLTASADNSTPVASTPFDVVGPTLSFSGQPASGSIGPLAEVDVRAADHQGHALSGVTVTLALQDAGGSPVALGGTLSVPTDAQGIARFTDLSCDQTGQDFRLTATADNARPVTSDPFNLGQTLTWTGGGDGVHWSDPDNWDLTIAPASNDSLVFPGGAPLNANNDLGGLSLNTITLDADGYSLTGNDITLTGGLTSQSGSNTYALNTFLGSGNVLFRVADGTLEIQSVLGGSGGFTQAGTGQLILDQDATYAGVTTLLSGAWLKAVAALDALGAGPVVIGAGAAPVTLDTGDGGSLALDNVVKFLEGSALKVAGNLVLRGALALAGQGSISFTDSNNVLDLAGGLQGSGTLVTSGDGTVTVAGDVGPAARVDARQGTVLLGGRLLGADPALGQVLVTGGAVLLQAALAGTGVIDVQAGLLQSGQALADFSGTITLEGGRVAVTADNALGTGTLLVAPTGGTAPTLDASGASAAVTLANALTFRTDAGLAAAGTLTLGGTVTLAGTNALSPAAGGLLEITGPLTGTATLAAAGAGPVRLSGPVPADVSLTTWPHGTLELNGLLQGQDPAAPQVVVDEGTARLLAGAGGTGAILVRTGTLEGVAASDYAGPITLGTAGAGTAPVVARLKAVDHPLGHGDLTLVRGTLSPAVLDATPAGAAVTLANPVTFQGDAALDVRGRLALGTVLTLGGQNALRFSDKSDTLELGGAVGGAGTLALSGPGTTTLTKAVYPESRVQVAGGRLNLRGWLQGTDADTAQLTADAGAILELLPGARGTGGITVRSGGALTSAQDVPYEGTLTLVSNELWGSWGPEVWVGSDNALGRGRVVLRGEGGSDVSLACPDGNPTTLANDVTFSASGLRGRLQVVTTGHLALTGAVTLDGDTTLGVDLGATVQLANGLQGSGQLTVDGSGTVEVQGEVAAGARLKAGQWVENEPDLAGPAHGHLHLGSRLLGTGDTPQVQVNGGELVLLPGLSGTGAIEALVGHLRSAGGIGYAGTVTLGDNRGLLAHTVEGYQYVYIDVWAGADAALGTGRLVVGYGSPTLHATAVPGRVTLPNPVYLQAVDGIVCRLYTDGNLALDGPLSLNGDAWVSCGSPLEQADGEPVRGGAAALDLAAGVGGQGRLGLNQLFSSGKVSGAGTVTVHQAVGADVPVSLYAGTLRLDCGLQSNDWWRPGVKPYQVTVSGGRVELLPGLKGPGGIALTSDKASLVSAASLPVYTGSVALAGGATAQVSADNALGADVTFLNGGTLTATAPAGGVIRLAALDVTGSNTLDGAVKVAGTTDLGTGSRVVLPADASVTLAGDLRGAGAFQLDGGTLLVAGANPRYTGAVTVTAGQVVVAADGALGTGPLEARLRQDGALRSGVVGDPVVDNPLTVTTGTYTLTGELTFPHTVTVAAGATLDVEGAGTVVTLAGPLAGGGTVTVGPGATLRVLGGAASFTGALLPRGGTLQRLSAGPAAYVTALYRTLLGRAPDDPGLAFWTAALAAGLPREQLPSLFWQSPEHRGLQADRLYATYLHRAADPAGRAYWVAALTDGLDETAAAVLFATSDEFRQAHPTPAACAAALYADVLGRLPDPAGLAWWTDPAASPPAPAAVARGLLTSPEHYARLIDATYAATLGRPPDPPGRLYWLTALSAGALAADALWPALLASPEFAPAP